MMTLEEFLQLDTRGAIERIGSDAWLTVYSYDARGMARESYFCALVPDAELEHALSHESWDLSIGDGAPGHSQSHRPGGDPVTTYHRFGSDNGIEPPGEPLDGGGVRGTAPKRDHYAERPQSVFS